MTTHPGSDSLPPDDPTPGNTLGARIRRVYPTLTPAHQTLADYVLAHPLQAATLPIDELALTAGVSVATANRFVRVLGLEGYPMLRAALVRDFEAMLAPIEKMRVRVQEPQSVGDVFATALRQSQRNIAATAQALDPRACEAAVDAVLQAQRIFLNGFGASAWLSGLLQQGLDAYCANVQMLPSVGGPSYGARMLSRMTEQDLMVVLSFPRYLTDTVLLARRAFERGVRVLALTDGPNAPVVPYAHIRLYAHTDNPYAANSESTVLALIEALCSAVAHRSSSSVQSAARMTETALSWLYDGHDTTDQPRRNSSTSPGQHLPATPPPANTLPHGPDTPTPDHT